MLQLFKNKLEDITNLCNTILLPIESLQTRTLQKRLYRKIYREIIIMHTALAYSQLIQTSKMKSFANMDKCWCLVLKLIIKRKRLVKKAWKWLYGIPRWICCLFKMNPAVIYEMDYYIFDQEIIFILTRAENEQNRNFWKQ